MVTDESDKTVVRYASVCVYRDNKNNNNVIVVSTRKIFWRLINSSQYIYTLNAMLVHTASVWWASRRYYTRLRMFFFFTQFLRLVFPFCFRIGGQEALIITEKNVWKKKNGEYCGKSILVTRPRENGFNCITALQRCAYWEVICTKFEIEISDIFVENQDDF